MLYDITPTVASTGSGTSPIAVFPGDTPPRRETLLDMKLGQHLTLSTLHTTVHVGAHADGENHYVRDGRSIDRMPLEHYIGRCQVVRARVRRDSKLGEDDRPQIAISDIDGLTPVSDGGARVLIRTDTQPDKTRFPPDFAGLEPALVDELAASGVMTIGVDTPSVDVSDSNDLPAHAAFARNKVAILEGLALEDVPPGVYELIALPLKLTGFDGSPVRAVLRTMDR